MYFKKRSLFLLIIGSLFQSMLLYSGRKSITWLRVSKHPIHDQHFNQSVICLQIIVLILIL